MHVMGRARFSVRCFGDTALLTLKKEALYGRRFQTFAPGPAPPPTAAGTNGQRWGGTYNQLQKSTEQP